jgi:REP element-mobilizing transposase RayT
MKQDPYQMNHPRRRILKQTILDVCENRDWLLLALHVRKEHLHAVLHAKTSSERVWNDFKSYGSRRLNKNGYDHEKRKRWTRGGSGIFLWETDQVQSAIRYTLHRQGKPMQRFLHPDISAHEFREYDHKNDITLREFFQSHGILDSSGQIVQTKERTIELRAHKENREEN